MYEASIENGMEWLDKNHPGWLDKIELSRLDLMQPCSCILGQVNGNFWVTLLGVFPSLIAKQEDEESTEWARSCGFIPPKMYNEGRVATYERLTQEWTAAILIRRQAKDEVSIEFNKVASEVMHILV